jgi:hypothetical protein
MDDEGKPGTSGAANPQFQCCRVEDRVPRETESAHPAEQELANALTETRMGNTRARVAGDGHVRQIGDE